MLTINIIGNELYNEQTKEFVSEVSAILQFEHSLLSLSKWESKYQKPFLSTVDKTDEEIRDYIKFMLLTPNVDDKTLYSMNQSNLDAINDYINSKESATTFGTMPETKGKGETITSELIYYWMVAFNIPFECESWHINRLFSLIRICNIKNSKPKKMSRQEIAQRNRALNEQRRKELNTSG